MTGKHPNTTTTGKAGEDLVCERLMRRGLKIIARNVTERFAEIDIVAEENETLVFVEVRTRTNARLGHPAETITPKKQNNIRRAAELYLARQRIHNRAVRFDVATVIWEGQLFEYFENAF